MADDISINDGLASYRVGFVLRAADPITPERKREFLAAIQDLLDWYEGEVIDPTEVTIPTIRDGEPQ